MDDAPRLAGFSCLVEAYSALIAQDEYLKWLRELD
jgi:hypothetical protein